MALPTQRTFTAKFTNPVTGEAGVGFALFDILPSRWTDKAGNQILIGDRQRSFDEGSDGGISIPLVVTDEDDDILPVEGRLWQMRVCMNGDWKQYIFTVPAGAGPLDLTDVDAIENPDTSTWYVPVPGPAGADGTDGIDGTNGTNGTNGTDGTDGAQGPPGPVASVAGVEPDGVGDVPLTAGDIGAVPATGGAVTGALAVTGTLSSSAGVQTDGSVHAAANGIFDEDLTVSGDADIAGSLKVNGRPVTTSAIDVDTYLAGDGDGEFSSAHRGSGMLYPEHTLEAYRASLAEGAPAIEVSVQRTKDGVLVCFHDTTVLRMTGLTGAVSDYTYSQLLNGVKVKAQTLVGAGWADQAIPTVTQVLDELMSRCIILLEPKTNDAVVPLQSLMDSRYPSAPDVVIWKLYYLNATDWAVSRGYKIWLYVDAATTQSQADAVEFSVDQPTFWGVPHTATDTVIGEFVARVNAYGDDPKKVMVWEVHRNSELERFRNLGVKGIMSPQWSYLYNHERLTDSKFSLKVVEPGMMGVANYDPAYAPQFDSSGRAYLNAIPNQSFMLGGHRPDDPSATYQIQFGMVWDTVPGANIHSGIAFGRTDDSKYQFSTANAVGGYHIAVRSDGTLQIYRHDPGVTSGVKLAETVSHSQTPTNGGVMTFTVDVTPTTITLTRTDVATTAIVATDSTYRGEYVHCSVGSVTVAGTKPYWTYLNIP